MIRLASSRSFLAPIRCPNDFSLHCLATRLPQGTSAPLSASPVLFLPTSNYICSHCQAPGSAQTFGNLLKLLAGKCTHGLRTHAALSYCVEDEARSSLVVRGLGNDYIIILAHHK